MTRQLEICCGDIASVLAAKEGGARRIELCSGLSEGGLTPSIGLIHSAVDSGIEQINVLIRPRPGDFFYSDTEVALMENDIREAIYAGATGIVIGVLTPDGDVDMNTNSKLISVAREAARKVGLINLNITFHRAFDVSREPAANLQDIIRLGCNCLLTSGAAQSAVKGLPLISKLVNLADGRIVIMAGSGINPSNAAEIIAATGVKAIHATARKPIPSKMRFRRPLVSMGVPGSDEYAPLSTSPDVVAKLLQTINSITS